MRSDNSATVKFLKPADCTKYYKDTSNGVVYKKDIHGHEMVVFVELAKDVDVIGGILQRWIEDGVSRCVRTVGVDEDWDMAAFIRLASAKNRIVEGIADGMTHGGVSSHNPNMFCSVLTLPASRVWSSFVLRRSIMRSVSERCWREMTIGTTSMCTSPWTLAKSQSQFTSRTRCWLNASFSPFMLLNTMVNILNSSTLRPYLYEPPLCLLASINPFSIRVKVPSLLIGAVCLQYSYETFISHYVILKHYSLWYFAPTYPINIIDRANCERRAGLGHRWPHEPARGRVTRWKVFLME